MNKKDMSSLYNTTIFKTESYREISLSSNKAKELKLPQPLSKTLEMELPQLLQLPPKLLRAAASLVQLHSQDHYQELLKPVHLLNLAPLHHQVHQVPQLQLDPYQEAPLILP